MNLKTKALGVIAAAILALSATGGGAAQDQIAGSATLQPNAAGTCSVTVTEGDGHLGTFTWDGVSLWVPDEGSGMTSFTLMVTQTIAPNATCNVSVSGTYIEHVGTQLGLGMSRTTLAHGDGPRKTLSTGTQVLMENVVGPQAVNVWLDMSFPLGHKAPTGPHRGTLTFTTSQGS